MKTKLLFSFLILFTTFLFAQKKENPPKESQKFYFPASSFSNAKDFEKNLNNLVLKISPMEINEEKQEFSRDADIFYLMQKDYKGLQKFSKNDKFPKESLPLKNYAEAMMADPSQGNLYKKTFTDNFSRDFNQLDEPTKTTVAAQYFDEKMLNEYDRMGGDFIAQLSKNKSDSITYKEAKRLINIESLKTVTKTISPLGKNIVKDYVLEYLQPFITGNVWMSVVKPKEVNDLPDLSKDYKLLFEIVNFSRKDDKETAFKNENGMLIEAGRIMNLHVASGISPEKLKVVFVIHGGAVDFLLNNKVYKEKYKIENPNLSLIKQMQNKGAKFVVCGQIMTWDGLKLSDLAENVKEAYSAKTALSNYQNQGYILYEIQENN